MDIFIIEDDKSLCREISLTLSKWGYSVGEVNDFENITNEVLECNPKLILMDINLPSYDGFYWCSQIRNFMKVPIIFISSRDNDMDIIMSINMGGDDYITKPLSPQVLVAKIQAILRRTYSYNNDLKSEIIKFKNVTLNFIEGKLYFKDENVDLTKNELKIMHILMSNQEKVVSREEIIEELWETDEFISENTLTVNVNRLRKKLSSIGLENFIETKKGQGYIIR
ncbi:response regulator transcription factor [Terrisporobacter sp.]